MPLFQNIICTFTDTIKCYIFSSFIFYNYHKISYLTLSSFLAEVEGTPLEGAFLAVLGFLLATGGLLTFAAGARCSTFNHLWDFVLGGDGVIGVRSFTSSSISPTSFLPSFNWNNKIRRLTLISIY